MPLPGPRLVALGLAAVLLAGCSYHAGDEAARDWDAWVADHPLDGARVTDAVGTNVQPFQGTFEAYARLTAEPSEASIVTAMASMCRFDDETDSDTTYWLQIDEVSLQAPCSKPEQQKVAGFWTAAHALPGIRLVFLSSKGLSLEADDDAITGLVPVLSAAADATGRAGARTTNDYTSEHVTITQDRGADLSTELALTQGVLDVAGTAVQKIQVVAGRVSAATSGTVAQAQDWQRSTGAGSAVLTVTPDHVTTELPFTDRGRDLVDRLAADDRALAVNVVEAFWEVEARSTKDARSLVDAYADEPAAADLGRFQLDVGPSDYDSATGEGRTCFVRPEADRPKHASAILDLCDLKEAVLVDDRFNAALSLRLRTTDLKAALACLKRAPYGLPVYLMLPQNETEEFTTGATLEMDYDDVALEKLWESLPSS